MKNRSTIFTFLFCFSASILTAQQYKVDTIHYSGDPGKFINLVFLGDGYQDQELASFKVDVQKMSDYLFSIQPFTEYRNYFNVFAIEVPSFESGTNHPGNATDVTEPVIPVVSVTTAFNSTFDYFSIHRLLVPQDGQAIYSALIDNLPLSDQVVVIVNSPEYGGSGGQYATSSLHDAAPEIVAHEIGHSFGYLADEYYAGDNYAGEYSNMTQETDTSLVRWKKWLGVEGVGIYQHCCGDNSAVWYRPHEACKMRYLGPPFCPVCRQSIVERIHELFGNVILEQQPSTAQVGYCGEPLVFRISTVIPNPNTLKTVWKLNGEVVASNIDTMRITDSLLIQGSNLLSVECLDTTWLTRVDDHESQHTYKVTWAIPFGEIVQPVISSSGTIVCSGEFIILTSSHATDYLWNTGSNTPSIFVGPGEYIVTITDANGCTSVSEPVTIVLDSIAIPTISEETGALLAMSTDTGLLWYQWYLNDKLIFGETSESYLPIESGSYTVLVTNHNGCTALSEPYDFKTSGVEEESDEIVVRIIPNPNQGRFQLQYIQEPDRVIVFTAFGSVIYESQSGEKELDLSGHPKGMYFLAAHIEGKVFVVKLVLQ